MAEYEIVIKNETSDDKKSPIAGDNAKSKASAAADSPSAAALGVKALVAYNHYIKPFVNKVATQYVSTISLRTGAQELEDKMSFALQTAQKVGGFVGSIAVGAAVGNLPGAIIGGLMSVTTTAIDIAIKQSRFDMERGVENVSLRYMNMRAGGSVASFSGSRMKNQ